MPQSTTSTTDTARSARTQTSHTSTPPSAKTDGATHQRAGKAAREQPAAQEAIRLLRADHRAVNKLFAAYEDESKTAKKQALVAQICTALSIHAQIEEEIFYPAAQKALKDHELVPEARVEHETLKYLIAQVEGKTPDGDEFDAKIKVMSEYVKHHVREEQNELFPKVKETDLDMYVLGTQLFERKEELFAAAGMSPPAP